jgi:hypothetical protein
MCDFDQSKVYFRCNVCDFIFQADTNFVPIKCPRVAVKIPPAHKMINCKATRQI